MPTERGSVQKRVPGLKHLQACSENQCHSLYQLEQDLLPETGKQQKSNYSILWSYVLEASTFQMILQ